MQGRLNFFVEPTGLVLCVIFETKYGNYDPLVRMIYGLLWIFRYILQKAGTRRDATDRISYLH